MKTRQIWTIVLYECIYFLLLPKTKVRILLVTLKDSFYYRPSEWFPLQSLDQWPSNIDKMKAFDRVSFTRLLSKFQFALLVGHSIWNMRYNISMLSILMLGDCYDSARRYCDCKTYNGGLVHEASWESLVPADPGDHWERILRRAPAKSQNLSAITGMARTCYNILNAGCMCDMGLSHRIT